MNRAKQVRSSVFGVTVESSKTKPFKTNVKCMANSDKFMVVNGASYSVEEIRECVSRSIDACLEDFIKDKRQIVG